MAGLEREPRSEHTGSGSGVQDEALRPARSGRDDARLERPLQVPAAHAALDGRAVDDGPVAQRRHRAADVDLPGSFRQWADVRVVADVPCTDADDREDSREADHASLEQVGACGVHQRGAQQCVRGRASERCRPGGARRQRTMARPIRGQHECGAPARGRRRHRRPAHRCVERIEPSSGIHVLACDDSACRRLGRDDVVAGRHDVRSQDQISRRAARRDRRERGRRGLARETLATGLRLTCVRVGIVRPARAPLARERVVVRDVVVLDGGADTERLCGRPGCLEHAAEVRPAVARRADEEGAVADGEAVEDVLDHVDVAVRVEAVRARLGAHAHVDDVRSDRA